MSSRLEDLRDLTRMLDEGKISQSEYDIVKKELLEAPAEEWATVRDEAGETTTSDEPPEDGLTPAAEVLSSLRGIPTIYRAALAGAVLVLVVGGFIATRSDAAGSVTVRPEPGAVSVVVDPPAGSLGIAFADLAERWNEVDHPPQVSRGISVSPEPGPLDSFLHRFDSSAILAGAYDRSDGFVYALMVRASLHDPDISNLYVHLCYLLHPGSQGCLDTFIEEMGMFGRAHADLMGSNFETAWQFEGHEWDVVLAGDIETIRVQGGNPSA